MKTEFLIPFEIDTSVIEQKLEDEGCEEIIQRLKADLHAEMKSILPNRYGRIDWEAWTWRMTDKFLEKHKDEIIDTVVLLIARKTGNRKRWRDVLKEIKEEEKGGQDEVHQDPEV